MLKLAAKSKAKKTMSIVPLTKRTAGPSFPSVDKAFFAPMRLNTNDVMERPYAKHSWTYALVRALATNISKIPLVVKTGSRKDPKPVEPGMQGYEWQELFDHPNPNCSAAEFKEAQVTWLSLSGECVNVKGARGGGRVSEYEIPGELWPYGGKEFAAVLDKRSAVAAGWVYHNSRGENIPYLPHEICQVKYLNPYYPLRGLAPLEAASLPIQADYKAADYNAWFFDNDATPGVVLVVQGDLTQEQADRMIESWDEAHQGRQKRRKTAAVKGGTTVQELGQTHREMEFTKLRDFSLKELCAIFKVPDSEIACYQNLNYATASSVKVEFWTNTLIPIMKIIEDAFYSRLMLGPGKGNYWVEFDLSQVEALAEDDLSKLQAARLAIDLGVPFDEVNEKFQLGYKAQDGWGKAPLLPGPRTDARLYDLPPDEQEPDPGDVPVPAEPTSSPSEGDEPEADEEPNDSSSEEPNEAESLDSGLSPSEEAHAKAWWASLNRSKSESWYAIMKEVFQPGEARFLSKYRNYLFKLRKEMLRRLEKSGLGNPAALADGPTGVIVTRVTPHDVMFPRGPWDTKLKAMERPVYLEVALNSASRLAKEMGGQFQFDVTDPKIHAALEAREQILAETNGSLYDRIFKSLEKGSKLGESPMDLAQRIKGDFNLQASRAVTIARTEVASAVSTVRYGAMEAEGVVQHEWTTARDESVRPEHEELDSDVVEIGAPFDNGLLYPCDPSGAPEEIINCRCVALPVVERGWTPKSKRVVVAVP